MLRGCRNLTGVRAVPRSSSRCFGRSSPAFPPINACSTISYAHALLGARLRAVLALARVPVTGRLVTQTIDRGWPGARVSVVVRTRFIDDALKKALADGIDQVVIVGSGFDTRAYRVPGAERAQIFEIDTPGTIQGKRTRIEALLGRLPPHVSTVATDLEREDLDAALSRTDFRRRPRHCSSGRA
jgi:methyltransferase (TIGR00027 family)